MARPNPLTSTFLLFTMHERRKFLGAASQIGRPFWEISDLL